MFPHVLLRLDYPIGTELVHVQILDRTYGPSQQ